jgi:hypothetical protein
LPDLIDGLREVIIGIKTFCDARRMAPAAEISDWSPSISIIHRVTKNSNPIETCSPHSRRFWAITTKPVARLTKAASQLR